MLLVIAVNNSIKLTQDDINQENLRIMKTKVSPGEMIDRSNEPCSFVIIAKTIKF